ncbi:hypothetical protein DCBHLPFO_00637 [Mycoplasmopsis arginini]|uniref:Uncharacterized protein n=1 Tax=Mycoplasmopsis arginini TaxID=2094 RepID=A0AA43QX03_MYCAR|nr:hypothetical protein [Mycoplasmopsis arginini]
MHWSRNWSFTDHVADHALNTWLIMHRSRDWSCTDHVAIMHCSRGWSCSDHAATMYWSHDWSCTDHVIDHALITWLIMHSSCDWSCADHVWCHTLIMCIWRQWTKSWVGRNQSAGYNHGTQLWEIMLLSWQ